MPQQSESRVGVSQLGARTRWFCAISGVLSVLVAFVVAYWPPIHSVVERGPKSELTRSIVSPADMTTPFIVLVAAGFALLLFALNGYRITRLTIAGVSADATSTAESAEKYYAEAAGDVEALGIEGGDAEAPQPTQPPVATLDDDGPGISVYELKDVPISVIRDALVYWPPGGQPPENLGGFEFASRKRGKGNNPWTLKFRGRRPVTVSYGGRRKTAPTVQNTQVPNADCE